MMLLHLVRWLSRSNLVQPIVGLRRGGLLAAEFEKCCPVIKLWKKDASTEAIRGIQLVYANTACHGSLVSEFHAAGIPVISHIHEMAHEMGLRNPVELGRQLGGSSHFIACSQSVADCLKDTFLIPEAKISLIHEPIDTANLSHLATATDSLGLKRSLGFPDESPVFCGVGTACWRKGSDLFLAMAAEVCRKNPNARGLWVGRVPSTDRLCIEHDIRLMGLENKVVFIGERANPHPYVAMADTFCLTSREDPYPLVMIEATMLGKPVIGFDKSGGVSEFAPHVGGSTVPYLDTSAMASAVLSSFLSPRSRATSEAAIAWLHTNLDIHCIAPRILEVIMQHALAKAPPQTVALNTLASRLHSLTADPFAATLEAAWDGSYLPQAIWSGPLRLDQDEELAILLPTPPANASRFRLRLSLDRAPLTVTFSEIHVSGPQRSKRPPAFRPGNGGIELSRNAFALLSAPARLYLDLPASALANKESPSRLTLKLLLTESLENSLTAPTHAERDAKWRLCLPEWLRGKKRPVLTEK